MATSGERILVVESNPEISDLISRQALQPLGYQVTVVQQASIGFQQAAQTPPDLLIANLNLPGLNAKDMLIALAAQGIHVPLIVIAEKGQEQDIILAFRVGAADYLHWPARDAEVVSVVERVLNQTREGRERQKLDKRLKSVNNELQRRVNELTILLGIGKTVVSITDQRALLERIVNAAVQVAEADLGWLMIRNEASKVFMLSAHFNLPDSWIKQLQQPVEDGISSLVSLSGESLLIHGKPLAKFSIASLGEAAAVIPIKVHNEVIGLLLVIRKDEKAFEQTEQSILEAIADYVSISMVNARLFRALEQAAEAAKAGEKKQNALLEALRDSVRNEIHAATEPLKLVLTETHGPLTEKQRQALHSTNEALKRLVRVTEKTVPPLAKTGKR